MALGFTIQSIWNLLEESFASSTKRAADLALEYILSLLSL